MTICNCVPIKWRYCRECHSQRKDETCWKCSGPTIVPSSQWDHPETPDVNLIRKLAKEVGYAIGEHGSREADLDVIAAPWTKDAVEPMALIEHICAGMVYNGEPAKLRATENKPVGRFAVTIQLNGWFKNIDLSICPIIKEKESEKQGD